MRGCRRCAPECLIVDEGYRLSSAAGALLSTIHTLMVCPFVQSFSPFRTTTRGGLPRLKLKNSVGMLYRDVLLRDFSDSHSSAGGMERGLKKLHLPPPLEGAVQQTDRMCCSVKVG